jgi:hypothetical protein
MGWSRFAVLLFAVLSGASPCVAHPKAECTTTRCDYGARLPGPLPPAVFQITNRGDAPLILKPQPCCGFTVTGAETPIPPGQTRRLVASAAHPLGDGLFRKTMSVLTNDPAVPALQLEMIAVGKSPILLFPGDELTVPLDAEIIPPQTVTLCCNDEPELKITSIRCSAPYVRCKEVTPLVPDKELPGRYRAVEISIADGAPQTPYEAVIVLGTNCHRRPLVKLHVYGLSPDSVAAQPPRLDFEPLDKKESSITRVVTLTRAMGPFKLLGVTASDPRIEVAAQMDPSGRFAELAVTFRPGEQRGAFHGTVTVRTDDPQRPRVAIPVTSEAD